LLISPQHLCQADLRHQALQQAAKMLLPSICYRPQNCLEEMKVAALDVDTRKRSLNCNDKGSLKVANDVFKSLNYQKFHD
ncbi:hypothetical protein T06_5096, partial [Trichinella sp. T6]